MINSEFFRKKNVRRFLAFYIDCLIISLTVVLGILLIDKNSLTVDCNTFFCWNLKLIIKLQLLFYFIYFFVMEYYFSCTIGKKIFGFVIISEGNKKIRKKFFLRTFLRLFPIYLFFSKEKKFIHEKYSNIFTKSPAGASRSK